MTDQTTGGVSGVIPQSTTVEQDKDKVADISARLSENQQEQKTKDTNEPTAQESLAFDMTKLSPEQLQQLKAMLAVTPERLSTKKANARTFIRTIGGKYVAATKNAYLALVYDPTRLTEVETHKIPVKFVGEDKFIDMIYTEFMRAERVPCEIVSIRQEQERRVEGEVVQRETGKIVEMEVKIVNYFFTVKLPDGTTAEIDGTAANA